MILRLTSWVPALALLAALATLAVAAAPVAWHWGGWSSTLPARSPASAAAAAPEVPRPADLGPILNLAPFGRVAEEAPAPDTPVAETALELSLQGVVVQEDPAESLAFIAHAGATQGYRPGDTVAGAARLLEVATTQVVLEVDGERQTLSFPDRDGAAMTAVEVEVEEVALSGPDRLRALVADQAGRAPAPPAEAPTRGAPQTTQDRIDLWRDRIRANPGQVLDAIGLIPGENGYTIAEEHDSGVGLAGLQAGDVVRSVNGRAVGDVDRDRVLFDEVAASGLATVEVVRGDRTLTLSFPLE